MTTDVPGRTRQLPGPPDETAVDGTEIRKLVSVAAASVVHCTLPESRFVSQASRNVGIEEVWYFLDGQGLLWRGEPDGRDVPPEVVGPGVCVTIPAGVTFQLCRTSIQPLTFLCITMPPWRPGVNEPVQFSKW